MNAIQHIIDWRRINATGVSFCRNPLVNNVLILLTTAKNTVQQIKGKIQLIATTNLTKSVLQHWSKLTFTLTCLHLYFVKTIISFPGSTLRLLFTGHHLKQPADCFRQHRPNHLYICPSFLHTIPSHITITEFYGNSKLF